MSFFLALYNLEILPARLPLCKVLDGAAFFSVRVALSYPPHAACLRQACPQLILSSGGCTEIFFAEWTFDQHVFRSLFATLSRKGDDLQG